MDELEKRLEDPNHNFNPIFCVTSHYLVVNSNYFTQVSYIINSINSLSNINTSTNTAL